MSASPTMPERPPVCALASSATPATPSASAIRWRSPIGRRNTSAATSEFVTGDVPIRNAMCATDVCCAAIENTVLIPSPKQMPAATTAIQRRASSRGRSNASVAPSMTTNAGNDQAARATATDVPSNAAGSAANIALVAGAKSPHPTPTTTTKIASIGTRFTPVRRRRSARRRRARSAPRRPKMRRRRSPRHAADRSPGSRARPARSRAS